MSEPTLFDSATYYDARDSEALSHETPEEAIIERLDTDALDPRDGRSGARQVVDFGPVEVTAYVRETISDEWVTHLLETLAEVVEENWSEDFGSTEELDDLPIDAKKAFVGSARPAVLALLSSKPVFRCRSVGTRTYTPEQTLAIAREEWDDLGEVDAPAKVEAAS